MNQSGFLLLLLPPVSPSETQRNGGATCLVTRRGKTSSQETFNVICQAVCLSTFCEKNHQ